MSSNSAAGLIGRAGSSRVLKGSILAVVVVTIALSFVLPANAARSVSSTEPNLPAAPQTYAPSLLGVPAGHDQLIWEARRGLISQGTATRSTLIELATDYSFDTSRPDADGIVPSHLRATPPSDSDSGYLIVQFGGAITMADHALIESFGGTVLGYVPDYALLVSLTGDARTQVEQSSRVIWTGLYHPAYKISPQPGMSEPGVREMLMLLWPMESVASIANEVTAAGAVIHQTYDNGINKMIRADLDTSRLASVARIEGISWIEPYTIPQLHNNNCQWVVQTWNNGDRRIWDMGIRGEGQIISVCDSGVRTSHQMYVDLLNPINDFGDYPTHRKIIAYIAADPYADILFGDSASSDYHGTHTACTVLGDDSPVGGSSNRDGMAYKSKLYFLDAGGIFSGILVPADLNDLFILPYNGNSAGSARIVSNSWGRDNYGSYDAHCMNADQFMWNYPDCLLFFSNGNTGMNNGVGSPAGAKNCMSIGGSMNGTSADMIYASTSRGPTDDGRYKPTICAPAELYSAHGASDTGYIQYHGTSMATPAAAGATGLIRQYLTEGWYPTGSDVLGNAIPEPSAALMKAMGINSADPNVAGASVPNNYIGWGRILADDVLYFPGDERRLALVDFSDGLLTGEYIEYQVYVESSDIPLKATLVWTDYPGALGVGTKLVNDLNLVAEDGIDTYLGNVYSSGESQTGGAADTLNVEECVRRDTPTEGVWTFRVEAINVPFGPQPFALVITGGLASDAGLIVLEQVKYGISDMEIKVVDLNASGYIIVTATSDTEPSTETVVLTGTNGVFTGSIPLRPTYPISQDGELSVSNGDRVTITYNDADPIATLVASAEVDLTSAMITDVHATAIQPNSTVIEWTTSTLADGKIYYGTTPDLGQETEVTTAHELEHSILLSNLLPDQTYYYDVESSNRQGNAVRDDNGGLHYTVSTPQTADVLLVVGDNTFNELDRYENAFHRTGWSHATWEGNQSAVPFVGDPNSGMASYKAVVWQTGYEQYPAFTEAAMDSITKLMDLGSRLAVFSHDVAWDFCDPTSEDYTAERCQWMEDELMAEWQEDPLTWDQIVGYSGDPISGGYAAGISYTPFRSGAAGDEIDGVANGGSFSYVWKNNETSPDDIGLRWTCSSPVGDPSGSLWGGTPNKISSNFFEWAQINDDYEDDEDRADILDNTLTWLVGRDNLKVELQIPDGGEVFTGNSITIAWNESVPPAASISERTLYYSDDSGQSWNLITESPGDSPYYWVITDVPNGQEYRVRIVIADDGSPQLCSVDGCEEDFTIDRPGGDTRGPKVVAGSMVIDPNPAQRPYPVTLTARLTDVMYGNNDVVAAEWSSGSDPAPAGDGTAMSGSFDSPTVDVSASISSLLLVPGTDILWVRGQDAEGTWGNASALEIAVVADPSSVDDIRLPLRFALHPNMPNPFHPVTTIRFDLPHDCDVDLTIYDVSGRRVRTLVDGKVEAGHRHATWDGRDRAGHTVANGIYFYRLKAGEFEATKQMTYLK